MPGNGVGDRVHNFFAQDNLSQGPRSQVVDGNWPLNDNLWVGSQKQFSVSDSSPRNYNLQQPETERGHGSQRVPGSHIFNITQTAARPESARTLSHQEQPNSNGYMYGRQNFQTRPDEANFLGVDTEYGRNNVNQRGFSFYESQQETISDQTPKNPFRPETSEAHGSFDLFGGQHQMDSRYPGMMSPLHQQQSGFGDIQQLQQQLMLRKMQELQRQQNSLNQASPFARQASGSHSQGLINGNPTSDSSGYGWTEANTNWLQHGQRSMGFVQQQVDQSLYGVPVSNSRGPMNQYPHIATDKASIQQLPTYNNSFPGNHYAATPEPLTVQDGASVKSLFGNTGMKMDHIQQLKPPTNSSVNLVGPAEIIQDKSATEATSPNGSAAAASLDPDEEKILFGSDDNIWDAFGSSKNMSGGVSSLLDDNEFAGGLPSMQSGTWSALMQSAVAESSSGGVGLQEEWPDLNFQNPELPSGKHTSKYEDSGKHQTALGDINLPNASALDFGSVPLADGSNMNDKQRSNMGFQHHGKNNPYEHDERLNVNYSKQMNQHSGSNWLNCGVPQKVAVEESRLYENSQQYGTSQAKNKQNHWNVNESVPPSANTGFNINENDNSLQQSQSNDWKRVMHDETGQGDRISSINPLLHPNVNREGLVVSNTAAIPNLSNLQGGNHSNQFSPNNHHLNYWKHVDSSTKSKGSENSEKSQRRLKKGPQVSESSFNSSDKEDLKMHEMESSSRRENSNDSYRSGSSHLANTVGQREKFSSDAGDSRSLPGTKQSLPNQVGRKTSSLRKFQYHPMGNLDEDVVMPYGTRQGNNTNAMSLQHSRGLGGQDQGNFGHAKQGYAPELEGVPKGSDDMRFKGMIPGHVPNIFAPHDRSVGLLTSDKATQPSQNMLELLHKVDQSRDRGIVRQNLNSFEHNLSSEMPEPENSDGSFGGHHRSLSSNSQGIGLQLGPPSQRLPLQTVKPNSRSKLENHQTVGGNESFNGHIQISQPDERVQTSQPSIGEKLPAAQPHANSGMSQQGKFSKMLPNAWANLPTQQLFLATQARKGQLNIVESASLGHQQNLEEQEAEKSGNSLSKRGSTSLNSQVNASVGEQLEKESSSLNLSPEKVNRSNGPAGNDSINMPFSDASSQRDFEAFGRSLKPNSFHQNYSLLNQMKVMKNTGNDPNNRVLKRLKDSDNLLGGQQVGQQATPLPGQLKEHNNMLGDASISHKTVPPADSESDNIDRNVASLPADVPSKDILASDRNGPQSCVPSNSMTSGKIEHSHINPQMAPSWFDQYGTFKSGHTLSQRADAAIRPAEPPVPSSMAVEQLSSAPLPTNIPVQSLTSLRSKKRKCSTTEVHPWLKEVLGGFKNLQGICTASMGWSAATNRLMEKVEDDGEVIEDVVPVPKPKRRIILTTQLMQQLFPAPPATILSTDATSNYESVAFYAARLALGDACNLVSSSSVSDSGSNTFSDKSRESERVDDRRLSEVVEENMSKSRRLEDDFSRLDKRASILDLRVEFQDLEKFSIINRFAKFHGRGQAEGGSGVEASTSDAAANIPKPFPQRYVVAVPLPKNLPERVQCLSL